MKETFKISLSELCYYLFFSILFFAKGIGLYDGQMIFKICLLTAAIFVCVKIVLTSYSVKEMVLILLLMLLGVLVYKNSGEKSALVFLIMMIGAKNISFEKIMKVGLYVWGTAFGLMILTSLFGSKSELIFAHHKFGMDLLRRGMGYSHPNVLHVSYAILVVLILFSIQDKRKKRTAYILTFIGNIAIFLCSVSYTGFMLVLIFLVFQIYFSMRKEYMGAEKIIIGAIFPMCVLFSLLAPLAVEPDTPLFLLLNKLLNRRFYASRLYLLENPVTLFGQRISASHTYALDSSYVTLFIYGGLVLFGLVCVGYMVAIYQNLKRKNGKALSVLLSFSIAGVIEPFLFNLSFKNLSLMVVAVTLYSLSKEGKRIALLSEFDRQIEIPYRVNPEMQNKEKKISKKGIAVVAIMAVLSGVCFMALKQEPDAVYVGAKYCDIEGEPYCKDEKEMPAGETVKIYGKQGAEQGYYRFAGNTLQYDKLRDAAMISYLVFLTGYFAAPYIAERKKGKG